MSEGKTIWALRALAFALAILAWAFISLDRERQAERPFAATIQYNIPSQLVLLEPVETVSVRLNGPASVVSTLNPFDVFVVVDLTDRPEGPVEVPLTPRNVIRQASLEVVSIQPNVLTLELDRLTNEIKPVVARLAGEPAAGAVAGTPSVLPESVLVRGPASILSQIQTIDTRPINLTGHAIDFSEQALLRSPDPLITVIEPSVVTVQVPLQIPNAPGDNDQASDAARERASPDGD